MTGGHSGLTRLISFSLVAISMFACSGSEKIPPRLQNGFATPTAVAEAVVNALNEVDRLAMRAVLIREEEYINHMWHEFPASANWPADFAYANLNKNCTKGINRWSSRFGGKSLTFVGIRFERPREEYESLRLHRGTVLRVRDAEGKEQDLRILGSIVEMDGRFKLLSYDEG